VTKYHYYRRAGAMHISPEAEVAYRFIGSRPSDLYCLGAEMICLQNVLDLPASRISEEALVGIATTIDSIRLLAAAIPSEKLEDLEYKQQILFEDRDPLMAESALLPLLIDASLVSDEFRLGLRRKAAR
jgi:hypothetical protein